jgi:hypothetical protein
MRRETGIEMRADWLGNRETRLVIIHRVLIVHSNMWIPTNLPWVTVICYMQRDEVHA